MAKKPLKLSNLAQSAFHRLVLVMMDETTALLPSCKPSLSGGLGRQSPALPATGRLVSSSQP
jgi:hypothetical protein